METRFCMAYSCGKDSTLALYKMIKQGDIPVALLVTTDEQQSRSWFHGVSADILSQVSASLGIPLIQCRCHGDNYTERFVQALRQAGEMGATACAFGDIDIAEHRAWGEAHCGEAGLAAVYPLWQRKRLDVVEDFIKTGFTACIKAVSKQFNMSREFLGKTLTMDVLREIVRLGLDPCGENGEYHTFCSDGPIFSTPVQTNVMGIVESEYAYSLHLESLAIIRGEDIPYLVFDEAVGVGGKRA